MRSFRVPVLFTLFGLAAVLAVAAMSVFAAQVIEVASVSPDRDILQLVAFGPPLVMLAFLPVIGAALFLLRRNQSHKNAPDETELVQVLARRANEMSQRLEAVETILLDRSDHYRETAGRS